MITTKNPDFFLRPAKKHDVPLILSFIRELAAFEKLEHEVEATEEILENTLFGATPHGEVLLGYYHEQPVAFALFFHNFSTFLGRPGLYLEDLYVKKKYRGQGLGKIMLSYLAVLAKSRGCGRFEWWCLDWNESALGFYRSLGAVPMSDWTVQRVSGEDLDLLANSFGGA